MANPRLYRELNEEMRRQKVNQLDLGALLNLAPQAISARMNGATPWKVDEAHKVHQFLGLPPEELARMFPPGGKSGIIPPRDPEAEAWRSAVEHFADAIIARTKNATTVGGTRRSA